MKAVTGTKYSSKPLVWDQLLENIGWIQPAFSLSLLQFPITSFISPAFCPHGPHVPQLEVILPLFIIHRKACQIYLNIFGTSIVALISCLGPFKGLVILPIKPSCTIWTACFDTLHASVTLFR